MFSLLHKNLHDSPSNHEGNLQIDAYLLKSFTIVAKIVKLFVK